MKYFNLTLGFILMDIPLHQLFIADFGMVASTILVGMFNVGVMLIGSYRV